MTHAERVATLDDALVPPARMLFDGSSSPEQFITVQRSLATDGLNEYLKHVGSAIFAVPAGVREGEFVGQALFA